MRTQTSEVIGLAIGSFRPHGREEKRERWIGVLSCDQSEGTGISSSPAHSQPSHWPAFTLDSDGPIDSFQRCLTMERARGTRKEEGWRPLSLAVSAWGPSLVFSSESDDAAPPSLHLGLYEHPLFGGESTKCPPIKPSCCHLHGEAPFPVTEDRISGNTESGP